MADNGGDMTRGPLRFWNVQGITILCKDGAQHAGELTVEELVEFATYAQKHFPDEIVRVTAEGLRVTRYDGQRHGPHLDWRDWT